MRLIGSIFFKLELEEHPISLKFLWWLPKLLGWVICGILVSGNDKKVRFWEDNWLGSSSLAIQYWNLYKIVHEKNCSVEELWDGVNLKCTFRRTVGASLFTMWEEVCQFASTICFSDEEDSLIWQFTSNGIFSTQFLYKIVHFRGVKPMLVSSI